MRTTQSDIEEIMDLDSGFNATPFITIANSMVTDVCLGSEYASAKLALIETWLAAHFITVKTKIVGSEKVDVISQKFKLTTKIGLNSSHYGQTAMSIDTEGNLAQLNRMITEGEETEVGVHWGGIEDYDVN